MHKPLLLVSALVQLLGPASAFATTAFEAGCEQIARSHHSDAKKLQQLIALSWKYEMHESPEEATFNGYPGENDHWSDLSKQAVERRRHEIEAPLQAIRKIRRAMLSAADRLNYDLFRRTWEDAFDGRRFPDELLQISQLGGVQQYVPQILAVMPRDTDKDLNDVISRLEKVPTLIDQTITLLDEGIRQGITPPKITMRDVPDQVKSLLENDPDKNPILAPFRKAPAEFRERAAKLLTSKLIPAYQHLREYLVDTYIPKCRATIGWSDLPDGKEWYAHRVRHSTTTKLSPEEIHEIGQSEVRRIRHEMDAVMASTGFKGSFEDFREFLRSDSRFFYNDREELLRGYRDIAKRIDPGLIRLFGKLPRLPYGVCPVPAYAEKSQTTAYYEPGSPEAARAGCFFANTYDLKMRPKWEMEALTLHEAVPGHHLQIALAQEMQDVPDFRKFYEVTAFVEGWGLYAESLGPELGMYEDPYSKFGQLTYEMWRAIRLVLDTGIHKLGWTRDKAISFFKENSTKTDHDITVEVDRYIVWSGQALAYKIGELRIKALREMAKKELGKKFNIRAFHDTVLKNGAVPLDVLSNQVAEWVAGRRKAR